MNANCCKVDSKHAFAPPSEGATKISISVVICTYNGAEFIAEQIESILSQTLLPKEIVVGDDGSNDKTWLRIEELRKKIEEKGIKLTIYQYNHMGPHGNFKATLPKATCEFIAPCDQDDIWLPEKLEKCAAAMVDGVDVVYCDEYILHEDGHVTDNNIRKPESVLDQLFGTNLAGHLLLMRHEMVDVYAIAPEITFDYGVTIAASCRNRIAHVTEKLCYWRRHDAVVTTSASNHNPYEKITKGKLSKWIGAMKGALMGERSVPVRERFCSIEAIIGHYAEEKKNKQRLMQLCRAMQKQTAWAICRAGWLYMILRTDTLIFKNYNIKNKLAAMLFNFTYPAGWWYEYHIHKSL